MGRFLKGFSLLEPSDFLPRKWGPGPGDEAAGMDPNQEEIPVKEEMRRDSGKPQLSQKEEWLQLRARLGAAQSCPTMPYFPLLRAFVWPPLLKPNSGRLTTYE